MSSKRIVKTKLTHHIIYVPGLGDSWLEPGLFLLWWKFKSFHIHIYRMRWNQGSDITPKLAGLVQLVDRLASSSSIVSLIGFSAGGSAVLNTFILRPKKVHRVISVCGRIREGVNVRPSLAAISRYSPTFLQSVQQYQACEPLSPALLTKVLTIRPRSDRIVPPSTVPIEGATNLLLPCRGHALSCILAFSWFSYLFSNL